MKRIVLLMALLPLIQCYKILSIFPTAGRSHWFVGSALLKGLAKAGHEVTMVSPFPLKEPMPNYRDIYLQGVLERGEEMFKEWKPYEEMNSPTIATLTMLYTMGYEWTNYTLNYPELQNMIRSKEKYDLVIIEIFATEAMIGFGHAFDAPVIGVSSLGTSMWTNNLVGTPAPWSYIPHTFLSYTDNMTFSQRLFNSFVTMVDMLALNFYSYPMQEELYDSAFPDPKPTFDEALRHGVSLVLLNSHFSLSYPQPYAPNMIEVGGMHINREINALPPNIQSFIDEAKDGVIYFSMGSILNGTFFPDEVREAFVSAFSQIKQRVLWKYEKEIPYLSTNVMIQSWMPQNDILAHPNVKAFITHGGLLGSTEAIYHGIPVIGIPIYGDQRLNTGRSVLAGRGLQLNYKDITVANILNVINQILNNHRYRENSKVISARYRDQPMNPLDTAIYWCEYVIRNNGATHLQSAAQNYNLFQYLSLDILLTYLLIGILIIIFDLWLLRKLCKKYFCKKCKKNSIKKDN